MDFGKYFRELKRRKVFKAAIAYLAVAWVLVEVASVVLPAFGAPPILLKGLIILLILGFPVNLIFSWVYDVTPEGLKRTEELPDTDTPSQIKGRRLNRVIIGFLSVAVIFLLYNQFVRERPTDREQATGREATESIVKSIAVLPFEDNSPEGKQDWLASQLVEDINNGLGNIDSLRVIRSGSVEQLVSQNISVDSITRFLNLTHLLEGSVLRIEDRIRINVKLFSTADNTQVWFENYDRDMSSLSIYDILDEVAASVGRALEFQFNASEVRIPDAERTSSTEAYELFKKAEYLESQHVGKLPPIVREYLERAIALDSTFYAAYTLLGYYWSSQYTWDGELSNSYEDDLKKANELIEFAIEKAPLYGASYHTLGINKIWYEQKFKEGYELALKGFRLNPSTENKQGLSNTIIPALGNDPQGNYRFALEVMEEAPLESSSWAVKGLAEYFVGKHEDAIATLEEGLDKFRDGNLNGTAARVFYALGEYEKVVRVCEGYLSEFPSPRPSGRILGYLAAARYKLGNMQQYASLMEQLKRQAAVSPVGSNAFHLAMVSAQTGDHEAAFQWLDKAIEGKEVELYWLKVEPPFKPLYSDPRWEELLDDMGFPRNPEKFEA